MVCSKGKRWRVNRFASSSSSNRSRWTSPQPAVVPWPQVRPQLTLGSDILAKNNRRRVIFPQDGEVNAAPVSGGLGKGVTGGEWNLPCIYPLPWSPTYLNPANLTTSTHCLSLFTFQFPSLSTFQISKPPAVLLFSQPAGWIRTRLIAKMKYKMNSEHLSYCQVKHVLAGSEYSGSAAAQRDERALVFGDDVPADKFRSCKKHGSDPRFQLCPSSDCIFPCRPFYLKPEFSLFPPLTLSHDTFDIDPIFYFVCMVFWYIVVYHQHH